MTFVFDLDDTLYLERDYVRSGFHAVARLVPGMEGEAFEFLWGGFLEGVRGTSFDRLLERFSAEYGAYGVEGLVEVYRSHEPEIELLPGYREMFAEIKAVGCRLALISDGPLASQEAKVRALGLRESFDQVVLTDALGPDRAFWKPHPRAFEELLAGDPEGRFLYFADNPAKDFDVPLALGWDCTLVRYDGCLHLGEIEGLSLATTPWEVGEIVKEALDRSSND